MAQGLISPPPQRLSSITELRYRTPYANYPSLGNASYYHPHVHPAPEIKSDLSHDLIQKQKPNHEKNVPVRWASLRKGLGSRHILDDAAFSLWDDDKKDFRYPNDNEQAWIQNTFKAPSLTFEWPTLVIHTDDPPQPLPLTVACVSVRFVPAAHVWRSRITNNGLANPRIPDPVSFRVDRWSEPDDHQISQIMTALMTYVNVKAVNFTGVFTHVEVRNDGREYSRHSLPGRVGGISTLYHLGPIDFWPKMTDHALSRIIDPNAEHSLTQEQDRSNYLNHGQGTLQPGVCLGSSPTTAQGTYSDSRICTSAGIRLRDSTGQVVMTAANHGFPDSDEVYYPTRGTGEMIGEIQERWVAEDVAMVKLRPEIRFSNQEYFNATPPRRLLRIGHSSYGQWCSADGMSCGTIFLQREGRRVRPSDHEVDTRASSGIVIPVSGFYQEPLFGVFGPVGGEVAEGICGAPIVEEDSSSGEQDGGGVCGFFRMASDTMAVCSCLDAIIDRSWELY